MNKELLFAALRAEVKEIEVKAVGAVLRFRVLTGKARDSFRESVQAGDQSASHFEASLVAAVVVAEDDTPLFTKEDVATLQDGNALALAEMARHAMAVNKIGAEAEDAAAKN
jgi:hypothetical protein